VPAVFLQSNSIILDKTLRQGSNGSIMGEIIGLLHLILGILLISFKKPEDLVSGDERNHIFIDGRSNSYRLPTSAE